MGSLPYWDILCFLSSWIIFNFDCGLLSWHSEQALLTARRDPILSRDGGYQRPRYPNVYDSYAEATKMAAFVGGARVSSLSTSVLINSNKLYSLSWY